MEKKAVYLIDLAHESQLGLGSDHMPLQLGLIGTHLLKEVGDRVNVEIFKFIGDFERAVRECQPFVVGASNYMWNINLGYQVAHLMKKHYPETTFVFGGPNYPTGPEEQASFMRKYPAVDFWIHRDGEIPFARLVRTLLENPDDIESVKKAGLPSCHAVVENEPYFGELEARTRDLSVTPSPYLTGLMDKFFDHPLVPSTQTDRGCPFACTFCIEGEGYYNKVAMLPSERSIAEVEYIVARVKHTQTLRIVNSNFGMFKKDVEFCQYLGELRQKTGYPDYISCSTGKNQKERILKCTELVGGAIRVSASVQSLVPEVLRNVKRDNISLEAMMTFSQEAIEVNGHVISEIILGLPGDSLEGQEASMAGLVGAGVSNVVQHQLALLPGTEVASDETRKTFGLKSAFRPIQRCVGQYCFVGETFTAADVEEISISTDKLSFEDYLEARRLYLTVGLFYNDGVFQEIHSLLRLLGLPSWEWLKGIHKRVSEEAPPQLSVIYEGFIRETKGELWEKEEDLNRDVSSSVDRYIKGEIGDNLIYKYRALGLVTCFDELHGLAFSVLREYLAREGVNAEDAIRDIERFSKLQRGRLLDVEFRAEEVFDYSVPKLGKPSSVKDGQGLNGFRYEKPSRIVFAHTAEQRALIQSKLDFHGGGLGGLIMVMSRFPLRRFYREASIVE